MQVRHTGPIRCLYIRLIFINRVGCSPLDQVSTSDIDSLATQVNYTFVVGPSSARNEIGQILASLPGGEPSSSGGSQSSSSFHYVDSLPDFNNYINQNFANVTPGQYLCSSFRAVY